MAKPTLESHATTADIIAAAGVHQTSVCRWGKLGLLPAPVPRNQGRRGRTTWWPTHAPEQAIWVKRQLDAGLSVREVLDALARGEFVPGREAAVEVDQ